MEDRMLIRDEKEQDLTAVSVPSLSWGIPSTIRALVSYPPKRLGIDCEYDVPDDVFMLIELQPAYLRGVSGTIKYHAAFSNI
jgi:hypothetical protein